MNASWIHVVARTQFRKQIFADREVALYAWQKLRAAFPEVLAAMLMPEHLHLIVRRAKDAVWNLGVALRSVSRHMELPAVWESIPAPSGIADRAHLLRTVRYVNLNPCRRRIVDDPLAWEWSTHRDVLGLVADPWVQAPQLARELHWKGASFRNQFHEYLCREDCVSRTALRMPPALEQKPDLGSLTALENAFAIFRKTSLQELRQRGNERKLLLQLALLFSQASRDAIAKHFQVSIDTLERARLAKPTLELENLRCALGPLIADRRLALPDNDAVGIVTKGEPPATPSTSLSARPVFTRSNAALRPHSSH